MIKNEKFKLYKNFNDKRIKLERIFYVFNIYLINFFFYYIKIKLN
jgi:hypothetical protein